MAELSILHLSNYSYVLPKLQQPAYKFTDTCKVTEYVASYKIYRKGTYSVYDVERK